jgi:peroxiredoxin
MDLNCDRIPDVPITLADGGKIDLSHFRGQKLILFFCPAGDPAAAARETHAYQKMAPDFEHAGAWVVGIMGSEPELQVEEGQPRIHLGVDADGSAFRVLASFVPENLEIGIEQGTTFLIDRDGGIRAAWPGCGHAAQALEVARERP